MRKSLFLLVLFTLPLVASAQFEGEDGEEIRGTKESKEPKDRVLKSPDANEVAEMEAQAKLEVDAKDLKALSDAKVARNEEGVVRAASRILGVDSRHLQALNTLGVFYFEQGKFGLAKILFNRALQAHPSEPGLHNNLGIVLLSEGKQRQALLEFRKALDLKHDYRVGAANLGAIFLEYKDYERAVAPLEAGYRATRSELKSGTGYAVEVANNYAIALAGVGKNEESKEIYDEIVVGSSRNPTVLLNYAILLVEKMKNYKEGGKLLSRIKFAVDDPKVLKRVEELEAKLNEK